MDIKGQKEPADDDSNIRRERMILKRVDHGFRIDRGFSLFVDGTLPVYTESQWISALGGFEQRFEHQPTDAEVLNFMTAHRALLELPDHLLSS